MKYGGIILSAVALLVLVHLDASGTHLLAVSLALAVAQGSVLVVAAAELSNAQWIEPLKKHLLAVAPVQLLFPLLVKVAPYPWLEHPTAWLSRPFFVTRNVALLLVTALVALLYRRLSLARSPQARKWAVVYVVAFVISHTVVAVDWVMSFDYPWISTMFPALYMVEAFYAGLGLAGILCFRFGRRPRGTVTADTAYDTATLLFGFALFWGGLFYAQYLTIWYGNIPEEVAYFAGRFARPGGQPLFTAMIVLLFVVPFVVLLVHRARRNPSVLFLLSNLVILGLFLHRYFHLFPHLRINALLLLLQLAAVIILLGAVVRVGLPEPGDVETGD